MLHAAAGQMQTRARGRLGNRRHQIECAGLPNPTGHSIEPERAAHWFAQLAQRIARGV